MKQLKIELLEILVPFPNKKIITINEQDQVIFVIIITSNMKVMMIEIKIYQ